MSVLFDPLAEFNEGHLGAFWARQQHKYPKVRSVPPINSPVDDFENQGRWLPPAIQLAISNRPHARLQMTSSNDEWMCQVQHDRLVMNWRKREVEYPRFTRTLEQLCEAWQDWTAFLNGHDRVRLRIRMWEMTYVNRIPRGELWNGPDDWPDVLPGLWGARFVQPEGTTIRGLSGQWVWDGLDQRSRIYVEPQLGRSKDTTEPDLLVLSLTARGIPSVSDSNGDNEMMGSGENVCIRECMKTGHALIINTFDEISSIKAKEHWGRHADS